MFQKQLRLAMLASALLALCTPAARADGDCGTPCDGAPADCGTPCRTVRYRTVTVTEWVPETYQEKRTVCTTERRTETYTAYKTEMVPVIKTRTVSVNKLVPETHTETRCITECVPVTETRTVMETRTTTRPVTHMESRCEDHGHFECREVCCPHSCCTHTVQTWVSCPVAVQVPVTTCETVCIQVPVERQFTRMQINKKEIPYQVTTYRCVSEPREEQYTVMTCRQVPYEATRCVEVVVPHEEIVTLTRMVPHCVEKVVCEEEDATCCNDGGHGGKRFRLFGRCR